MSITERPVRPVPDPQQQRQARAEAALAAGEFRFRLFDLGGEAAVEVANARTGGRYAVTPEGCSCEDALRNPNLDCKHKRAVEIWLGSGSETELEEAAAADLRLEELGEVRREVVRSAVGGSRLLASFSRDWPDGD